jgi:Polyketide cyclase / dehydrase and lipid transport
MSRIHVEAERLVNARANEIYQFFADYRVRHPSVLPPENFLDYAVESGGQGAGTIVRFRMHAGGRDRPYRMEVSEPEPGRVLAERDTLSSLVTTFTMTREGDGAQTCVRIASEWEGAGGIGGFFERTFAPGAIRGIYTKELGMLAAKVEDGSAPGQAAS